MAKKRQPQLPKSNKRQQPRELLLSALKEPVERERIWERRVASVTAGQLGNLLQVFRENQGLLATLLAERSRSQLLSTHTQKAVVGLATQAFNLSRLAERGLCSGYAIQSLLVARAFYEVVTAAVYFHSHPDEAEEWLDDKDAVFEGYARVTRQDFPKLIDEYISIRSSTAESIPGLNDLASMLPRVYGLVSKFSHPGSVVARSQLYFDGKSFALPVIGPNDERLTIPYSIVAISIIMTFQLFLEALLLIEFRSDAAVEWPRWATMWEGLTAVHMHQLQISTDLATALASGLFEG